jgi:hypothetical protein
MTEIRIELPLPLDITGTLINVIGLTYPGAMIKDDGNDKGWRMDNRLVIDIPEDQRHKSAKKAEKYQKVKAHLDGYADSLITELGPKGASFALPEYMMKLLVQMARECWEQFPDAKNYLETTVSDGERGQRYIVTVAKSDKQTPHAIAEAAKAELEALRAELAARPTACCASCDGHACDEVSA